MSPGRFSIPFLNAFLSISFHVTVDGGLAVADDLEADTHRGMRGIIAGVLLVAAIVFVLLYTLEVPPLASSR